MQRHRQQAPWSGEVVRVTSNDPRRDAWLIGHDGGTPGTVRDARSAALRRRFVTLLADGLTGALATSRRDERLVELLMQVARAYERIADDLTTLEAAIDGAQRRDQIMHDTVEELTAMAELSTGRPAMTWNGALIDLRDYIDHLVAERKDDIVALIAIDLAVERIEYIEKLARAAVRSYRGYLSA